MNNRKEIGDKNENLIKIDVDDEINFWNFSKICYVFSANLPVHVMEGYFRRVWRSYNVDNVAIINRGVSLVRFQAMDSRDAVLNGHFFFDKKPLIMKIWSLDIGFVKEHVKTLPVWVQLRLPLTN